MEFGPNGAKSINVLKGEGYIYIYKTQISLISKNPAFPEMHTLKVNPVKQTRVEDKPQKVRSALFPNANEMKGKERLRNIPD